MNDTPYVCDDSGLYTFTRPVAEKEVIEIACSLLKPKYDQNPILSSSRAVIDYLKLELSPLEREVFVCFFLNSKNKMIAFETIFLGTINFSAVHPREIIKRALYLNARAVIFAHNHPSGDPSPSREDIELTETLKAALKLVDLSVLDHIIVAGDRSVSLSDRGLI